LLLTLFWHSNASFQAPAAQHGSNWRCGSLSATRRQFKRGLPQRRRRRPMLDEKAKERLRTLTVEVLLVVRAAHLASPSANQLKHWDMIQDRVRSAARTSATPEEWVTTLARKLQLPTLNSSGSSAIVDLVAFVAERQCAAQWLDLIEREHGYLMALTRLAADKKREERNANTQAV
jgi:hypothetical protein